jgi:hypothetical protein
MTSRAAGRAALFFAAARRQALMLPPWATAGNRFLFQTIFVTLIHKRNYFARTLNLGSFRRSKVRIQFFVRETFA